MDAGQSLQVQVISKSTTFYPIETRNEEGLTIINSIAYLQENFGESINSFSTEQVIVVMQMWNDLLFKISAPSTYFEPILRFALQIVRDSAVFLFGSQFEKFMQKNIIASRREIYAKYIDKFLQLCESDYKFNLMILEYDYTFDSVLRQVKEAVHFDTPASDDFLEAFIFRDHKIVSRLSKSSALNISDVFQISLFERIEFGDDKEFKGPPLVPEAPAVFHRGAFIKLDGAPQQCLISSARLGPESQFTLIFVSQISSPTPEQKEKIYSVVSQISQVFSSNFKRDPEILPFQITGLIHYVMVNRMTGEYWESAKPQDPKNDQEVKWIFLQKQIKRKMASIAVQSLTSGCVSTIRNEMIFQYTYDLIFINSKKQRETLTKEFVPPKFDDGISFDKIVKENFAESSGISCYELMTVYLGVMHTSDVLKANSHLFTVLMASQK